MAGPTNSAAKLDQILAQLTTLTKRLDSDDQRIARTEKFQIGGDDNTTEDTESGDTGDHHRGGGGRGIGRGGLPPRCDRPRHDDDNWRRPRFPKLNSPHFDGESYPLPWLNKCDHFFRGHQVMEEEKVWTAALHLEGAAAEWYCHLERDTGVPSWPRFVDYINLRFGPPIRFNTLGELKELRRSGSVEEYQRRFLALVCRCDDLTTWHQIYLFIAGLGDPIKSDVELQRPHSLQTAMSLARAFERCTLAADPMPAGRPSTNTRTPTCAARAYLDDFDHLGRRGTDSYTLPSQVPPPVAGGDRGKACFRAVLLLP